jgi:DNA-binding PadR family transcriptional regulator
MLKLLKSSGGDKKLIEGGVFRPKAVKANVLSQGTAVFYQHMDRLCADGYVSFEYKQAIRKTAKGHKQPVNVTTYRLTPKGLEQIQLFEKLPSVLK